MSDAAILAVAFLQAPTLRPHILKVVRTAGLEVVNELTRRQHVHQIEKFCCHIVTRGNELSTPYYAAEMAVAVIFLSYGRAQG